MSLQTAYALFRYHTYNFVLLSYLQHCDTIAVPY